MKNRFMVLLVCFLLTYVSSAQDLDLSTESTSGVSSGNLLVELSGSPFTGSSLLDFGEFRLKYVVADNIAVRLGMYMDLNNNQLRPDYVSDYTTYRVTPGVEYQISNNGGFRSYVALDAIVGQKFANVKTTTGSSVTGTTQMPNGNSLQTFSQSNRGYFEVGAALSVGADYHFGSRFYVGMEAGFMLNMTMYDEITLDGETYQDAVTYKGGDLLIRNAVRFGFLLL
ncbi:hypothetical protein [Reichenbachiella ulvae]|uniref:Outer membrane protein beta-barrel domain-containing protein n=1 Tax=Reichenbachiella ulvae TaxID=2980104 RepID=A0ABT3CRD8_9BACT|nr:hypothetical protein [Reichenbachiella ulvae]MCV9386055.1 hypothetical protein [Reichenbachiella ulvae]